MKSLKQLRLGLGSLTMAMLSLFLIIGFLWTTPVKAQQILYGLCSEGGPHNAGSLFHYNTSTGEVITDVYFNDGSNAIIGPHGSLLQACNGKLYGMSVAGGDEGEVGTIFDFNPVTGNITIDYSFNYYDNSGNTPYGSLIQASNGLLYGLTSEGGTNNSGVMFSFDIITNTYAVLFNFDNYYNTYNNQGMAPKGSLFQASNGKLYGLTEQGGGVDQLEYGGYGSLFEYDIPSGILTTDIGFDININGAYPDGSLMQASNGMIYGTTAIGVTYGHYGTMFEFDPNTRVLTTVGDFAAESIGYAPRGSLIQANNGKLYGTTEWGGVNNLFFDTLYNSNTSSGGVIFEYDPSTSIFRVDDDADFIYYRGTSPIGDLFQGANGNLYGMCATGGGLWNDRGAIFEFNITGDSVHTDYYFGDATIDGGEPLGSLIAYNSVSIVNPDIPTLSADFSTICNGETATLSIASGNLNSANLWAWYEGSCGGTLLSVETNLYVTPSVTTTYYARGEGGCISTPGDCDSITITVNPVPTPSIYGGPGFCESGIIGTDANDSYAWNDNNNSITQNITVTSSNTYTVTVTDINGCTASASEDLVVGQTPAAYAGGNQSICSIDNSINLYHATGTGSFTWTTSGDGYFVPDNVLDAVYFIGNNDILNGTVELELNAIDPTGNCTGIAGDQMTLTVITSPYANAGGDQSMCSSDLSYTLSNASGTDVLYWLTSGDGSFDDATIANPTYSPGYNDYVSGSVMLYLYSHDSTRHCDSVADYMTLTIVSQPYAYAGGDQTMCISDNLFVPVNAQSNGFSNWYSDGDGYFNGYGIHPEYFPGPTDIENGYVVLILQVYGAEVCHGGASDEMTLTIISNHNAYAGGVNTYMCSSDNDVALVNATYSGDGNVYWTTIGDGYFTNPSFINPMYFPGPGDLNFGYAVLTLTTTDLTGECPVSIDNTTVIIGQPTYAYAGGDQTMCTDIASFYITNSFAIGNIQWYTGGDGYFDYPNNVNNLSYYPGQQDIANGYVVLIIEADDPYGSCSSSTDEMNLIINPAPQFIVFGDEAMCADAGSISLSDIVATGGIYYWFTQGDGYFDNPQLLNPIYYPGVADFGNGSVYLNLEANDINNLCTGSISSLLLTIDQPATANAGHYLTMCASDGLINITNATGTGVFQWQTEGDGLFDNPNSLNTNYSPSQDDINSGGVYLVLFANDQFGVCNEDFSSLFLTIDTNFNAHSGGDLGMCASSPSISITNATGTGFINWTTNGDGYFDSPFSLNTNYYPGPNDILNNGTYLLLTTTNPNFLCPISYDFIRLTIGTVTSAYAGSNQIMCNSAYFTNLYDATGTGYIQWSSNGDGFFDNPNFTNQADYIPGISDQLAGGVELYLLATDPSGNCPSSNSSMFLTIDTNFNAKAGGDFSFCPSSPSIAITNATGSGTISWTTGGDGTFDDASIINPNYTPGTNDLLTKYTRLRLKTTNPNLLCRVSTDYINITIGTVPYVDAGVDMSMCATDGSININDAFVIGIPFWANGDGGYFDDPNSLNATYHPGDQNIYYGTDDVYLYALDPTGVCPWARDYFTLTINTNHNADAGLNQTICASDGFVQLDNVSGTGTILWTTDGDGYFFDPSSLQNIYFPGPNDMNNEGANLTLTTTNHNDPCPISTSTINILIVPVPIAYAGGSMTMCSGDGSITLNNASGIGSYFWTRSGDGYFDDPTVLNAVYHPGINDIFAHGALLTLTVFDTTITCYSSDNMILTINTTPVANAGGDITICSGTTSVMISNATGAGSFLWFGGDGTFDDNTLLHPTYSPGPSDIANGSVILEFEAYTPSFSCGEGTSMMTIYINSSPSNFITTDNQTDFCEGGSVDIFAGNYSSYSWSTGSTDESITATTTNTYYVTVTDVNGCTGTQSLDIFVFPFQSPVITANGSTVLCQGNSVTLNAGAYTGWNWNTGDNTQTIDVTITGTYTVTVTNSYGCTGITSQDVTVNSSPSPVIIPNGPTTFCDGGSVTLDAGTYTYYHWSNGGTDETINATTTNTYSVTVTTATACTGVASMSVSVFPIPAPVITASGATNFCQGSSVTLDAGNYLDYIWSTGAISQAITENTTGTYSVTVTNGGGCTGTASQVVTVNTVPTPVIIAYGSTTFCAGRSVVLDAGSGYSSYHWSNGSNVEQPLILTGNTYTVTVTSANGCTGTASQLVTVYSIAPATITANGPTSFCQGGSVSLTTGNYTTYYWNNGDHTQTIVATISATYIVTVTDANECTATASQLVTVGGANANPVINANGPIQFCQGGSVSLSTSLPYNSYIWSNGAVTQSTNITTSGTYTVTVSNGGNCTGTAHKTITVLVNPQPVITPVGPTVLCSGGNVTLAVGTYYTYSWSNGATSPSILVSTGGIYAVTVSYATGCSASAGTIVEVVSCPVPTSLSTTAIAATSAEALWVQPSCAYNYTIQISKHNANVWTSYTITPNSHYTFSALAHSTSYDWIIRTNCNASQTNVSPWSTVQTFTTLAHRDADEIGTATSFNVYPNPANEKVTVSFNADKEDNYKVRLTDVTGRIVLQYALTSTIGENQYQMDLSQVAKGIYMVILQNKDAILKSKIVVN